MMMMMMKEITETILKRAPFLESEYNFKPEFSKGKTTWNLQYRIYNYSKAELKQQIFNPEGGYINHLKRMAYGLAYSIELDGIKKVKSRKVKEPTIVKKYNKTKTKPESKLYEIQITFKH